MKYHTLFVIFEKSGKIWNCRLMQIIGGALRVNFGILTCDIDNEPFQQEGILLYMYNVRTKSVITTGDKCMLILAFWPVSGLDDWFNKGLRTRWLI